MMDAGKFYSSGGQLDYEEDKESCQACPRPGLQREEVTGSDALAVRADEVFRLVRNIQVDAIDAQSLHLVVDGACDDIPGRELGAGIELLHERGAVG